MCFMVPVFQGTRSNRETLFDITYESVLLIDLF